MSTTSPRLGIIEGNIGFLINFVRRDMFEYNPNDKKSTHQWLIPSELVS